jgi:Protein of unknown function (DUF3156)
MKALTGRRAERVLADDVEAFERLGYRPLERTSPLAVPLEAPAGAADLVVRLHREGRVFGGNLALEVTTAEPVLPAPGRELTARGQGVVKLRGVRFRARSGHPDASSLAEALSGDDALATALGEVHFERVAVDADGRPVIRHMGGSIVWVMFPPIVRATPLPPGQPEAIVAALEAFTRAGERAS